MPWRKVWEPNPSNENITVHETLPEGFKESVSWGGFKTAMIPVEQVIAEHKEGKKPDFRLFYHCKYCKGWIEGQPYEYREDSLGPLCGRCGTTSSCIRCGVELGFSGIVS